MSETVKRRLVGGGVLILFGLLLPMLAVWSLRPHAALEQAPLRVYEIADSGATNAEAAARPAATPQPAPEIRPRIETPAPAAPPGVAGPEPSRVPERQSASSGESDSVLPAAIAGGNWIVQVGSFSQENNALAMMRKLANKYPAYTHQGQVDGRLYYRVRIGPYADADGAEAAAAALRQAGYNTQVQRRRSDPA